MLREALRSMKLLVMDFDGVFTDNTSFGFLDEMGALREGYVCNHADGTAIGHLRDHGDPEIVVVSSQQSNYVFARCKKLGIRLITNNSSDGSENGYLGGKAEIIQRLMEERGLESYQVGFIGNDRHDISAMKLVGIPIIVADAEECVRPYAKYVTERAGGKGAVRDLCDSILISKGVYTNERVRVREL